MPGLPTRLFVRGVETGGHVAILEHTVPPGVLGGPPHRHSREDECSYVLEGELTVMLGERTLTAGPGAFVFKPRGEIHAFWNAGPAPCRFLEIISPSGFERFFEEMEQNDFSLDPEQLGQRVKEVSDRYGLEHFWDQAEELMRAHGLRI